MSTLYLPAWSIGPNCYKEVYEIVRPYGKKVAVIGGHTALSVAMPKLKAALEGTDLELTDPIWFGGEASYENAAMLEAMDEVKNADVIFGVGGGRAMDTAKCAAGHLNKPIFAFPTLASNCASCTTLCVMYYPDGAMRDLYYPKRCAIHTFMDSEIIANSPAEYVWAGIGDSLAKEFESEFAARNDLAAFKIQHAPLMGTAIAKCCTSAFLHYGEKAMEQIRNHVDGYELQQVTLGIVITAGMVSNLTVETVKNEYFYNDSIAHGFYYGCTVCPGAHKHLHGELVSMGILVLLTLGPLLTRKVSPHWRYWAWAVVAVSLMAYPILGPVLGALFPAPIQLDVPQMVAHGAYDRYNAYHLDNQRIVEAGAGGAGGTNTYVDGEPMWYSHHVHYTDRQGREVSIRDNDYLRTVTVEGVTSYTVHWTGVIYGAYRGVTVLFLLWMAAGYGLGRRRLLRWSTPAGEEDLAALEQARQETGCRKKASLYRCPKAGSPLLLGFAHPVILLPETLQEGGREAALAHELTHHVEHLANAHGLDDKDEEQLLQLMQEYAEGN